MNQQKPIIEVKNIGKKYKISHMRGNYVTLRDILTNIMRSPLKFLAKKTKQITGRETKEEFWALKDISFSINRGEIVGVIGHNGAGKSTILKILSRITPPTEGEIILRGRVGSLLEVGTGFHPELTGRENIMFNGAILGMSRKEIAAKFDQIVEFSGVEKFLDTPVKHYSSGMYVRLGFSVAAHMESDILIVDEVLAVGDMEFQKKSLGKIGEVTKNGGKTVLFVSHSMEAIKNICQKVIILRDGKLAFFGSVDEAIKIYSQNDIEKINRKDNSKKIYAASLSCQQNPQAGSLLFTVKAIANQEVGKIQISLNINDRFNRKITTLLSKAYNQSFETSIGENFFSCEVSDLFLEPGVYNVDVVIGNDYETFDLYEKNFQFEIKKYDFFPNTGENNNKNRGVIMTKQGWKKIQ